MRRWRYVAPAAVALLATLAACGGDQPSTGPQPGASPASSPATDASTPAGGSPSDSSPATSPTLRGGSAERPAVLEPRTELLDWTPVPGPVRDTVTRHGDWTLTVTGNGGAYSLEGPGTKRHAQARGTRVSDALLDDEWGVVVLQDRAEQRPSIAEVTELATGTTFRVDGRSDVPTTNGGTWALGDGRLLHATVGAGGSYCVATVDLATRESTPGWCAPRRHGFNGAHLTPAGASLMTFDDSQPSCRTLVALEGERTTPFEGVPACKGWDGVLTDDGAVWSVIPNEHRVESAHFYARAGDAYFDLGPGAAGTLVWCAGAAYFVRDPQTEGAPAALMRWTADDGLTVAYESPGGQAFLAEPRCGGDTMTVTALAEDGDEQVSAPLS